MRVIIDMHSSIVCEVGEKVEIDGVIYVGVTRMQEVMGVQGYTILNNFKLKNIKIIQGKQKNGSFIRLIPEGFIKQIVVTHKCEVGEKLEID